MSRRVILHVGCPKTGTTALQHVLATSPEELAKQGFLYPISPDGFEQHFAATQDLHGSPIKEDGPLGPGAWDRLAEEVNAWSGTAIVSHELLASCPAAEVKRAVESFGDAEVSVVITARDLARQIPSAWQEHVKHGLSETLPQFIAELNGPKRGPDRERFVRHFWAVQDLPHVAMRWAGGVGAANVIIVTVPASREAGDLVERFGEAIGLDTAKLQRDGARQNSSMGIAETEFIRRFNQGFAADIPEPIYHEVIRESVVRMSLGPHRKSASLRLPPQEFNWVRERSLQWVEALKQAGYPVVGDLQELVPTASDEPFDPDDVDETLVLDAAIRALSGAASAYADVRAELEGVREELAMPTTAERVKRRVRSVLLKGST